MPPFHRIGITARTDFEDKENVLQQIVNLVIESGADVCIDPERCKVSSLEKCVEFKELRGFDLVIVVGGDGTILRAIRELKDFSIPLLTINRGTIGFLAECDIDECETLLPKLLKGEGIVEERNMLTCAVTREGREVITGHVLNEITISQGAIARIIELNTGINEEHLITFRSDGVIIATTTGSTAYNLAAGGAIMHPQIPAMILTPINAHAFNQKPLIIPSKEKVEIEVLPRESEFETIDVSLTLDGQTHHALKRRDIVKVETHPETIKFLKRRHDTFYETLRGKLGWGE
jgi:NAD+ kinase